MKIQLLDFYTKFVNKQITIYTDSIQLATFLNDKGYRSLIVDNLDFINSSDLAFCIPTTFDLQAKSNQLWKNKFDGCILALFSAIKFDNELVSIKYTLEHFFQLELEDLLNLRKKMYDLWSSVTKTQICYNNSRFEINLAPQLETANFDEVLHSNWQYSIAEICEASIVNLKHDKSSFCCDGIFYFDGIIHTIANQITYDNNIKYLKHLIKLVNSSHEKYIVVKNNFIVELNLDGKNQIGLLEPMKYHELERGFSLTEIAIGCNKQAHNNLDWTINSVANEGIYGTHVGIGTSAKCPHIDFIKADVIPG